MRPDPAVSLVHVISLARSAGRRAAFTAHHPHLDFCFEDAVDGLAMTPEQRRTTGLFDEALAYTPGAFGCALSHLALWRQAIDTGHALTVAEDDAVFRHDFHDQQARALAALPPDWEFVLWGWNFDAVLSLNLLPGVSPAVMVFSQEHLRTSLDEFQAMQASPALLPLEKAFGIPAYTVSPAGARRLQATCFPLTPFRLRFPLHPQDNENNGLDIAMNRAYPSLVAYACLPPLAATPNERASSTIQVG